MISRSLRASSLALRARAARPVAPPVWVAAATTNSPISSRTSALAFSWSRPRMYSASAATDATADSSAATEGKDASATAAEESPEDAVKKQLESKDVEIRDLKDKYLRSVADFRNLQDRTAREVSKARDFAISKFAKDLIDSVDNLDRALLAVPAEAVAPESTNKDLKDLHNGLKMTETILMQALSKHGIMRFDPSLKNEKFDPNIHEASFMTKMEDKPDGTVFNTISKGYMLNGRIIRAAKVGVVKNT